MSDIKLDNRHITVLEYIYDNPYISYSALKKVFPAYNDIEDIILLLEQYKLLSLRVAASFETDQNKYEFSFPEEDSHLVSINGGNAIIEEKRNHASELNKKIQPLYDISNETSSLAKSASSQAESAQIQACIAVEKSQKADTKGWIAIFISVIALAVEILTNFDTIISTLKAMF